MYPLGFAPWALAVAAIAWGLRSESRSLSDEAARQILATMADGLLVCDAAGRIELVNPVLCSLTGFRREALLGLPMVTLFSGSGQDTFAGSRWRERTVTEDLATLHGAAGELLDVSVSFSQLHGEQADLRGAVVLIRDIRETRQAQVRLAESQQRLAEAQRLAKCGHWRWQAGDATVTGSDELFRILGLPLSESAGWRRVWRLLGPSDRSALRERVEGALRRGSPFQVEVRVDVPGHGERSVHVRGERLRPGGEPAVLRGTAQDVSERRESEKAMRALVKAVESSARSGRPESASASTISESAIPP